MAEKRNTRETSVHEDADGDYEHGVTTMMMITVSKIKPEPRSSQPQDHQQHQIADIGKDRENAAVSHNKPKQRKTNKTQRQLEHATVFKTSSTLQLPFPTNSNIEHTRRATQKQDQKKQDTA